MPPLKFLHSEQTLVGSKLTVFEQLPTEEIVRSLAPGCRDCLKTRADGTIIDGHHRVYVLRLRGVDVDSLARETVEREDLER